MEITVNTSIKKLKIQEHVLVLNTLFLLYSPHGLRSRNKRLATYQHLDIENLVGSLDFGSGTHSVWANRVVKLKGYTLQVSGYFEYFLGLVHKICYKFVVLK